MGSFQKLTHVSSFGMTALTIPPAINEKAEARALSPAIAWPTLVYGVLVIAAHLAMIGAGLFGLVPLWALVLPLGFTAYLHYTLVHESVHRNIVSRPKSLQWIHTVIGWYGSLILFASWPLLERTHKHHHAHVNTDRDPDIFVKLPLKWLLVRNAITAALQCVPMLLLKLVFRDRSLAKGYLNADQLMTAQEKRLHFGSNFFLCALFWTAVFTGSGWQALALYYLPAMIGLNLLTILFQWLPHHPFEETTRYRATRNTGRTGINLPMVWQNWHLMHHLWPSVPFYNYERLYKRLKPVLEEKGARHHDGLMPGNGPVQIARV